jgi:hypothetical protein
MWKERSKKWLNYMSKRYAYSFPVKSRYIYITFVSQGVTEEDANRIISILTKNKKAFIDIMMAEELGIAPDIEDEIPWKHGAVIP